MRALLRHGLVLAVGVIGGTGCSAAVGETATDEAADDLTSPASFSNGVGTLEVHSTTGSIDNTSTNPFFKQLGINGRTCNSCHKLDNALGISLSKIRSTFTNTNGLDPLFRINDGSNAPTGTFAKVGTLDERKVSFSMLLNHGTIRVGIGIPTTAEFTAASIQDPYGFAKSSELSLFRRPLPSVNVAFNTQTMWDGRESEGGLSNRDALKRQSNDATQGHAQRATPIDDATRSAIADFQLKLFSAQRSSNLVGSLSVRGCDTSQSEDEPGPCVSATGNARNLVKVLTTGVGEDFPKFFIGINEILPIQSDGKPAATHNNVSMIMFEGWESETLGAAPTVNGVLQDATLTKNRGEIGDGENIFYTKPMTITGVKGLNDISGGRSTIIGTCTTCHNTPNVGNHSRSRFMNTSTSSPFLGDNPLAGNLTDFPKYTLRNKTTGAQITTTDPGKGLRTGRWNDINKFKVPNLRGLGNRPPFFHNGAAKSLTDIVNFYNQKFKMNMTSEEIRKVVVFLRQT